MLLKSDRGASSMQAQVNLPVTTEQSYQVFLPRARQRSSRFGNVVIALSFFLLVGAIVTYMIIHQPWENEGEASTATPPPLTYTTTTASTSKHPRLEQCRVTNCGQVGPRFIPNRIIGGRDARLHEFPYQVVLTDQDNKVFCGGSMINDRWIVTAANCLRTSHNTDRIKSDIQVSVAILHTEEISSNKITVEKFFVHPYFFKEIRKDNDIALIKTSEEISRMSKRYTNPICLPFDDTDSDDMKTAHISGFGVMHQGDDDSSETLRSAKINFVDDFECVREYFMIYNPKSMVCAGDLRGGQDTCQGDSGGPLAIKNANGSYVLKGVTSFGHGCGVESVPSVYTKVSHYMDWMCQTMIENGLN